jgi:two-component system chemotaxis response regulator CheB
LLIVDGVIRLGTGPREDLVRPAIDALFRSAAVGCGSRTIGVVLSGMLNDGAAGLAAIKRQGGIGIVQARRDATAGEMPLAALEATPVDLSAEAVDLGPAIATFVSQPPGPVHPVPADLTVEVAIAAGGRIDTSALTAIADPVALTCPDCGGVLSAVREHGPLRFRCQVGHGHTAKALYDEQEGRVDEA